MAFNLKNILFKYNLTPNDTDALYQRISNKVSKQSLIGYTPEEMTNKLFVDNLEKNGLPGNVADKIASYYSSQVANAVLQEKKKLANKIANSTREPIDIVTEAIELEEDDAMQTSGQMNSALGMNKRNPKYGFTELYGKKTRG